LSPELASIEGATWLIRFPKNRDGPVSKAGLAEIDRVASVLKRAPLVCVEISGHVAHMPGAGFNEYGQDLSLKRAHRVRELLIERGVPAWRLETRGAAYDEPVDTNSTAKGRRRNDRIEFTVLRPP
jgi:outer membrane protein OmpA-like peptidoglycan-associated protein